MPHELCCSFVYWSLKCDCAHCVAWMCALCLRWRADVEGKNVYIIACLMQYELSHFAKDVANVSQEIPRILNIMTWSMHGFTFYCIMLRELWISLFYFYNEAPTPTKKTIWYFGCIVTCFLLVILFHSLFGGWMYSQQAEMKGMKRQMCNVFVQSLNKIKLCCYGRPVFVWYKMLQRHMSV